MFLPYTLACQTQWQLHQGSITFWALLFPLLAEMDTTHISLAMDTQPDLDKTFQGELDTLDTHKLTGFRIAALQIQWGFAVPSCLLYEATSDALSHLCSVKCSMNRRHQGDIKSLVLPTQVLHCCGAATGSGGMGAGLHGSRWKSHPPNPQLFIAVTPLPHTFSHPNWDVSL